MNPLEDHVYPSTMSCPLTDSLNSTSMPGPLLGDVWATSSRGAHKTANRSFYDSYVQHAQLMPVRLGVPRLAYTWISPTGTNNNTEHSFILRHTFNMLRQHTSLGQLVLVSHHAQLPSENEGKSMQRHLAVSLFQRRSRMWKNILVLTALRTSVLRYSSYLNNMKLFFTKSSWNNSHLPTSRKTFQLIWPIDHEVGRSGVTITWYFPESIFCLLLFSSSSTELRTIPKFR